jgi:hypothetical protein
MGHRLNPRVPSRVAPFLSGGALLGAVLGAVVMTGCEGGAPTEAYELSGRVTVFNEGGSVDEGVPNARVTFSSDTLIVSDTNTDDAGRYRMRVMTDHSFGEVRAEAAGFITGQETVYFDSPQRRIDLVLRRTAAP